MATIKPVLATLCLTVSAMYACAEEQSGQSPVAANSAAAGELADPAIHHWLSMDANLNLKRAGSHGTWGTDVSLAIQPVARHRLKLSGAYFGNDHGAATDYSDSSFGIGDFFSCLFGSCPDEDYNNHTGGNYFYEYKEQSIIYQYQLSRTIIGGGSYGEVWLGAGPGRTERTVNRYQVDNGQNYDFINKTKDTGVAWAIDFINRHNHWYWQASLSGSTSSGSFGGALGLGVGF